MHKSLIDLWFYYTNFIIKIMFVKGTIKSWKSDTFYLKIGFSKQDWKFEVKGELWILENLDCIGLACVIHWVGKVRKIMFFLI